MQGVLSEILSWAESQPSWQREALRRLVERGSLRDEDIAELIELCKQPHESPPTASALALPACPTGSVAAPMPLHLPAVPAPALAGAVTLGGIDRIHNVNALAPDCSVDFGERGLTIVYGENGSGKSGYARILKRACRARARGNPLRPNVFGPAPSELPRARIRFKVGDQDREFCWVENGQPHPPLRAVSFLDDDCAAVQLDAENEVAYRPFDLDLLEELAGACRKVREALNRGLEDLRAQQPDRLANLEIAPQTEVARALSGLNAHSSLATFETLAAFGEREDRRLAELRRDLDEEPHSAAARIQSQVDRLSELARLMDTAEAVVGDVAWQEFQKARDDSSSKRRGADLAASALFSGEPLAGVGAETWHALWEAARAYSETLAYPGRPFPVTSDGAVCVLCQQNLNADAADRLRRFERFVRESTQRAAAEAESKLYAKVEAIESLQIAPEVWRHAVAELRTMEPSLAVSARRYLASARWRRRLLLRAERRHVPLPETRSLPASPSAQVMARVESLSRTRGDLVTMWRPEGRTQLENERRELEGRRWLRSALSDVRREIERLKGITRLERADRDADSGPVTRKSTELARELLTDKLVARFATELQRLRVKNVRVELEQVGGRYGKPHYQIRLKGAHDRAVRCGEILSEGERRVVALAGFLAELATAEERSALVLDDPVSSLDHGWRRLVAERLMEEAADRQVIIFTHDVVFYLAFKQEAEYLGLPLTERQLRRQDSGTGVPVGDVPWIAMKTNERIDWLEKRLRASEDASLGQELWEPLARDLYGSLRETWERAVEQVLLAGAVERFGHEVRTRSLRKVTDFTDDDYNKLHRAMAKCSALMRGHDEATAANEPVPDPDEVRRDIEELRRWVAAIRKRRR
jgi:energy-coupling factor transporter ATP-binding protein EcfA2